MNTITLWKKYNDGGVRSITVNETTENLKILIPDGYCQTEEEAAGETKKVKPTAPTSIKAK